MTHAHILDVLNDQIVVDWFRLVSREEDELPQWRYVQMLAPYGMKFVVTERGEDLITTALDFLHKKKARTVYWRWWKRGISLRTETESALAGATMILAHGCESYERI